MCKVLKMTLGISGYFWFNLYGCDIYTCNFYMLSLWVQQNEWIIAKDYNNSKANKTVHKSMHVKNIAIFYK